jgi:hypothetical protein
MSAEPNFLFHLAGRIRNVSLPPTALNALIPLFEAIHAVESRFGNDDAPPRGIIRIDIIRREDAETNITGFVIRTAVSD